MFHNLVLCVLWLVFCYYTSLVELTVSPRNCYTEKNGIYTEIKLYILWEVI